MDKCSIIDNEIIKIFRKIEVAPEIIQKYTVNINPVDYTQKIKYLEVKKTHLRMKIERLAESISEIENSSAAKYIITQIEKENLNLAAVKRKIEETKTEAKKQQTEKKFQKSLTWKLHI